MFDIYDVPGPLEQRNRSNQRVHWWLRSDAILVGVSFVHASGNFMSKLAHDRDSSQ